MKSGLGWLLHGDLPELSTLPDADRWPDAPSSLVQRVTTAVEPLVRCLLLAGYLPYQLDIVRAGLTPAAITVDEITLALSASPGPDLAPAPETGAGVALSVRDLGHDRAWRAAMEGAWRDTAPATAPEKADYSHAIPVPVPDGDPPLGAAPAAWSGLAVGFGQQIVLWSAAPWLSRSWWSAIRAQSTRVASSIAVVLRTRLAAGDLSPRSGAGLLWLANPLFWFEQDPTYPGSEFDPALMSLPPASPAWADVTSDTAAALDPAAVAPPTDPSLAVMVGVATLAWGATSDTDFYLGGVEKGGPGRLRSVLHYEPVSQEEAGYYGWLAGNRAGNFRDAAESWSLETRLRPADDVRQAIRGRSWFEALLEMADTGLIVPAGYPETDVIVIAEDAEIVGEPLFAVYLDPDPDVGREHPRCVLVLNTTDLLASEPPEDAADLMLGGMPLVVMVATDASSADLGTSVAWDYVPATEGHLLVVTVVVGPGVEVQPQLPPGDGYELEVFRVWNYAAVPPRGARVQPEFVMAPFPIYWTPTEEVAAPAPDESGTDPEPDVETDDPADTGSDPAPTSVRPLAGVAVYPLPDGVMIEFPTPSELGLGPTERITARASNIMSGATAIAYDVHFGHLRDEVISGGAFPYPGIAFLVIWVSPGVEVTREWLEGGDDQGMSLVIDAWQVGDAVPLQGTTLPLDPGLDFMESEFGPPLPPATVQRPPGATRIEFADPPDPWWFTYALDLLDVGIGFVPIAGDIVDLAELLVSLYTNTDKWGRPVTMYDQMFMAVGVFVPFTSGAVFKGAGHAGDELFGLLREVNYPLLRYLNNVDDPRTASPANHELLELASTSRTFNRMNNPGRRRRVLDALARVKDFESWARRLGAEVGGGIIEERWQLVDLLTDRPDEFWFPPLQDDFRRWLRQNNRQPSAANVYEYLRNVKGPARAILEALLGSFDLSDIQLRPLAIRSPKLSERWDIFSKMEIKASLKTWEYYTNQEIGELFGSLDNVATELIRGDRKPFTTAAKLDGLVTLTQELLDGIIDSSKPTHFSVAGMRSIMGRRTLEPDDLAEMLLRASSLVSDRLAAISDATGVPFGMREYLRIQGHRSFFRDAVTQSGFDHGSLHEVMSAGEEYARRRLLGEQSPELSFWLQADIGSVKGPDMVRLIGRLGQLVECKSFEKIWHLLGSATVTGSAEVQLRRFAQELAAKTLILRTPAGVKVDPHWVFLLRVDPLQYGLWAPRNTTVGRGRKKRAVGIGYAVADIEENFEEVKEIMEDTLLGVFPGGIAGNAPEVRLQIEPLYLSFP